MSQLKPLQGTAAAPLPPAAPSSTLRGAWLAKAAAARTPPPFSSSSWLKYFEAPAAVQADGVTMSRCFVSRRFPPVSSTLALQWQGSGGCGECRAFPATGAATRRASSHCTTPSRIAQGLRLFVHRSCAHTSASRKLAMSVSGSLRLSDGAAGSVAGSSSVSRASRSSRRRRRQKAVAWLPRGSTVLQGKQSISSSLTAEIVAFAHRVQRCQAQGRDALLQLLGRLRLSAAQLWPSSILELYGSCATGIHLASSDIDLMLTVRAASSAEQRGRFSLRGRSLLCACNAI